MSTVLDLLLALACLGIVGLGVGLVVASWCAPERYTGQRVLRGAVVTVGFAFVLLAAFHPMRNS